MPRDIGLLVQDNHSGINFGSIGRQSVFAMSYIIAKLDSKINSSLGRLISKKEKKNEYVF